MSQDKAEKISNLEDELSELRRLRLYALTHCRYCTVFILDNGIDLIEKTIIELQK
jgi:hypothetical protein